MPFVPRSASTIDQRVAARAASRIERYGGPPYGMLCSFVERIVVQQIEPTRNRLYRSLH